ncbi:MAG: hypothetical protein GC154_07550 [bacterium]|nr:hypothetical protein [bacterium]
MIYNHFMQPQDSNRRLDLLILAQFTIGLAILFYWGSMRDAVLRFAPDDAFFYIRIALNWAAGHPSTFDGLTLTNGYHPLWQWLLIPLAWAWPSPHTLSRVAVILGLLFYAAAALIVRARLIKLGNPYAWFAIVWTVSALLFSPVYGMEGPLCVLIFTLLLSWTSNGVTPGAANALFGGLLTAALGLARLDHVAWVAALDVWLVMRARRERWPIRFMAIFALTQALPLFAYFLSNYLIWGHWEPISAALKLARGGFFSFNIPYSFLYAISLASIPLSLWAGFRKDELAWIGGGNLLYMASILARGGLETWDWYFALPAFSLALLAPRFIHESRSIVARWREPVLAVLSILAISMTAGEIVNNRSEFVSSYDKALLLAEYPEGEFTFAASDCGILGCFSRQHWLDLDGLTLDYDFQDALREKRLPEWLQKKGMNAYVDFSEPPLLKEAILRGWIGIGGHHDEARVTLEAWKPLGDSHMIMRVTGIDHPDEAE